MAGGVDPKLVGQQTPALFFFFFTCACLRRRSPFGKMRVAACEDGDLWAEEVIFVILSKPQDVWR